MEESNKHFSIIYRHDPEVTAGLKFKLQDPKVTFNIFTSGSIVLTGCTYCEFFQTYFKALLTISIINLFRKESRRGQPSL